MHAKCTFIESRHVGKQKHCCCLENYRFKLLHTVTPSPHSVTISVPLSKDTIAPPVKGFRMYLLDYMYHGSCDYVEAVLLKKSILTIRTRTRS